MPSLEQPQAALQPAGQPWVLTENELLIPSEKNEPKSNESPPFWKALFSWFYRSSAKTQKVLDQTSAGEILDSTPTLPLPQNGVENFLKLSPPSSKERVKFSSCELEEAIHVMSGKTFEAVMLAVYQILQKMEGERALATEDTYKKYAQFQELQKSLLVQIKDLLIQDAALVERFGKAQKMTLVAGCLANLAAAFGILTPLSSFLATTTTAGFSALATGIKAYLDHSFKEHEAEKSTYQHRSEYFGRCSDNFKEQLIETAAQNSQQRFAKFLERNDKLRKAVLRT